MSNVPFHDESIAAVIEENRWEEGSERGHREPTPSAELARLIVTGLFPDLASAKRKEVQDVLTGVILESRWSEHSNKPETSQHIAERVVTTLNWNFN